MIRTVLKRAVMTAVCLLTGVAIMLAQTTFEHIVERGETLSSIARKYHTTEARIIELNPDAGQLIYVGMKLNIPADTGQQEDGTHPGSDGQDDSISPMENSSDDLIRPGYSLYSESAGESKRLDICFEGSCGLPEKDNSVSHHSPFVMDFTLGVTYRLYKGMYGGARLGYRDISNLVAIWERSDHTFYDSSASVVVLPAEIGYRISLLPNKISIAPFAGVDLNCVVSLKVKTRNNSDEPETRHPKPDPRVFVNGKAGLRVNLWGFDVGAFYMIPFNKSLSPEKKAFPGFSIGWGF